MCFFGGKRDLKVRFSCTTPAKLNSTIAIKLPDWSLMKASEGTPGGYVGLSKKSDQTLDGSSTKSLL